MSDEKTVGECDPKKTDSMVRHLQTFAGGIDSALAAQAAHDGYEKPAFVLLVFACDGLESGYVANCDRETIIKALREQADSLESREDTVSSASSNELH